MTTKEYKYNFHFVGFMFAVVLLCAIICTTTLTYASEEIVPYSSGTLGGEPLLILGKNRSDDPLTVKKITDFSNIHFISNANYFIINPQHCKNTSTENIAGTCTTVAAQMLLGYHNYYSDRRIIPTAVGTTVFLNSSVYGDTAQHPNLSRATIGGQGCSSIGTEDTVHEKIFDKTTWAEFPGLGQAIGNVTDGANRFLDTYTPAEVKATISLTHGAINLDEVRSDIDNGIPVVIGMHMLGDANFHVVVAYGYAKFEDTDGFIVHYGWGDIAIEAWVPANWFGFQIRMSVNHTHNFVDTKTLEGDTHRIVECSECGYKEPKALYNVSNNQINEVNFPLSGHVNVPRSVKQYSVNTATFTTEDITAIGTSAFEGQNKITSITLPSTITSVDDLAFADCSDLYYINSSKIDYIGKRAFAGCISLDNFTIPSTTFYIGDGAFAGCNNLVFDINKGNTNYTSQNNVLYNKAMTKVVSTGKIADTTTLRISVNEIADYAFYNNSNLQKLHIFGQPTIGNYAFADCANLQDVFCYSYNVPTLNTGAFGNNDFTLHIPLCKQNEYVTSFAGFTSKFDSIPTTVSLVSDDKVIDTIETSYGATIQELETPFKVGYTFVGWYDNMQYNGEIYQNGGIWNKYNAITLYARWNPNQYYIHFDGYGSENLEDKVVTYDSPIGTLPTLSREGYTFVGWKDEYNVPYTAETIWQRTSGVTLTADFQANDYTINYVGNGGTPSESTQQVSFGDVVSSLATASRDGYTFVGWNTKVDGTGETISAPFTYNIANDLTLYAQYTANTYSVTFDKQGGTGGTNGVNAVFNSPMPTATAPTKVGYTFDGYFAGANGSGAKYYNADMTSAKNWNVVGDTTLYANWIANKYTVTFNKNGGSGGTNSVTVTYNSPMPRGAAVTAPTRKGYKFVGYYLTTNNSSTIYYNKDMISANNWNIAADTTLYAHWTPNKYYIAFDKQGGSGGTDSVMATYLEKMPTATAPTRLGYTFYGYYDSMDSSGKRYYDENMTSLLAWNRDETATLYARWKGNPYTITFDKQGGTGGTNSITITYGSKLPGVVITAPTRKGYTFIGYYEFSGGRGAKYVDGPVPVGIKEWDKASNETLYAYWEKTVYTVTLDFQYPDRNAEISARYQEVLTSSSPIYVYNYIGYDFQGIFSGKNGTGTQYFKYKITYYKSNQVYCYELISTNQTWNEDSDGTLYAYWTLIENVSFKYKIYISNAEEDYKTSTIKLTHGKSATIKAPTLDGYTFEKMWVFYDYYYESSHYVEMLQLKRNLDYGTEYGPDNVVQLLDPYDTVKSIFMIYKKNECIAGGSLITLADGRQVPVESLVGNERLLVWNLRTGTFDTAPLLFIDREEAKIYDITNLHFSDDTQVKVIAEHGFWDCDLNKYVYITKENAEQFAGHMFNKQSVDADGNFIWYKVKLTSVTYTEEYTTAWSPITYDHLCIYVNGMLSMPGATQGFANIFEVNPDTMQIDQARFLQDIEQYGLFTYEEFAEIYDVPLEVFNAFNGQYLKVAIGKGLITEERLLNLIDHYATLLNIE